MEAHGGKIWGENNTDGKGATFVFSLPSGENDNNPDPHLVINTFQVYVPCDD